MAKLVKLTRTIAVNPDHVASMCETDPNGVSVVMADGKVYGITAAEITVQVARRKGELLDHLMQRFAQPQPDFNIKPREVDV